MRRKMILKKSSHPETKRICWISTTPLWNRYFLCIHIFTRFSLTLKFSFQFSGLVLYNFGMIFFMLSFFVGYILSFGLVRLRTILLSARAGIHIERRCSRSLGEDVTITDVIIKTPDRNETGVRMTSCPEAMGWDSWWVWKKAVSLDFNLEVSWDPKRGEASRFLSLGEARPVGSTGCAARCWVKWNSQHSKNCVSLSSCRKNYK